jgi:polycomb group RING finger protein 4
MMNTSGIKVADLNPYLLCSLCSGYMIEASTIIECLHSYCRTCIYRYLDSESNKYCPVCDVQIHKTKPLLNVRPDKTLQNLIYKLVPGLLKDEMKRRQDFFAQNPSIDPSVLSINLPDEHHHVIDYNKPVLCISSNKQDCISLCLELSDRLPPLAKMHLVGLKGLKSSSEKIRDQRYLLCPSALTVGHLQRFLREKFDLPKTLKVDIYHSDEILKEVYTLKEIANIYTWRQVDPLKLFYVIYAPMKPKKLLDVNSEIDACNKVSKTDSKTNSVKKVDNPVKHGTSSAKTVSCKRKSTASEKVPEVKRRKTNTQQIDTIKGSKQSKHQAPVLLTPGMCEE